MTADVASVIAVQKSEPKDHNLVAEPVRETVSKGVHYEKRPVKGIDGKPVAGCSTPGSRSTIPINSTPTRPIW